MALLNHAKKELNAKIVYYGPGLSGKTTNLEWIHKKMEPEKRGKLISLETKTDRTLFFDFLPVQIGEIGGYRMRFNVYTVPGQIFYNETRKMVLKGVDGVVFVADCQKEMASENVESLKNLAENLVSIHKDVSQIPLVLQYNKMDLPNTLTVEEMNRLLNKPGYPFFEAIALQGEGVLTTLARITRMVAEHLRIHLFREKEPPVPHPEKRTTIATADALTPTETIPMEPPADASPRRPSFLDAESSVPYPGTPRDVETVPQAEPDRAEVPPHAAGHAGTTLSYANPVHTDPLLNDDMDGSRQDETDLRRPTLLHRDTPRAPKTLHAQAMERQDTSPWNARHAPSLENKSRAQVAPLPPPRETLGDRATVRRSATEGKEPPSWLDPSVVQFPRQPAASHQGPLRESAFSVRMDAPALKHGEGEFKIPLRIRHESTTEEFHCCLWIRIEPCDPLA